MYADMDELVAVGKVWTDTDALIARITMPIRETGRTRPYRSWVVK